MQEIKSNVNDVYVWEIYQNLKGKYAIVKYSNLDTRFNWFIELIYQLSFNIFIHET